MTSALQPMSLMTDFYGLRDHPFGVSPNPRFLYRSVQHGEALDSLILGIEAQAGFAALIAEPGTGKTTLLFDILTRYREQASIAFVYNTQCSGPELLRYIAMELQIPGGDSEQDPVRWHGMFTSFVTDRARTKPVVIIIDEAQNLGSSALEALRLLSNFEAADHKLMHIIVAGQPQLEENLRSRPELLQRVTTISRLRRFSPKQIEELIEHRLRIAGYSGSPLFTSGAMAKIAEASAGVPREINRICMNALQLGFTLQQKEIGVGVIDSVLSELNLGVDSPPEASGGTQFEAAPPVTQLDPDLFEIPADAEDSEMPAKPWTVDPSVDLSLGDEVIDSVMSELSLNVDFQSSPAGAQFEAELRPDPKTLRASGKPAVFYPRVDLGLDESIEDFLSRLNINAQPPAAIEPKIPIAPVESKVTKTPADRVLKVFAASKGFRVPIEPAPIKASDTPIVQHEEPWATNVKVEQWAQGSLSTTEPKVELKLEKTKEPTTQSRKRKPLEIEVRLSSKTAIWLCIAFVAALILLALIITHWPAASVVTFANPN